MKNIILKRKEPTVGHAERLSGRGENSVEEEWEMEIQSKEYRKVALLWKDVIKRLGKESY